VKALHATRARPATAQWGLFLRNHDELDLGRLSEQQRQTVFDAFGPAEDMQLYERGIRRRLAPMLNGDRRRIELANSLLFTLPGTPVIRYGDELGMGDNLALPERVCARTPMQWSTEPHAGFTKSERPVVPVIDTGAYGYQHVNAAAQRRDPNSLLNWTERIIRMRKEVPEIGLGNFQVIDTREKSVLIIRVRLAQQFSVVRAQSRRQAARGELRCRSRRPVGRFAGEPAHRGTQSGAR
jgi:maltose alpha-D-glucosyltransferase/alpha-amylase